MKNDNWTTPQALFDFMNERFNFNVDAAASKKNTKCKIFFTKQDSFLAPKLEILADRLKKSCKGKRVSIFCNPPYSLDMQFATHLHVLYNMYGIESYCLLPVRSDRLWYNHMLHSAGIRDEPFTGRIHFGNAKGSAFMYNIGVVFGFKDVKLTDYLDAGQFNKGGRGSATF